MARTLRLMIEVEAPDGASPEAILGPIHGVKKVIVVDESPAPGVQAAFIFGNGGPCHAVVKKMRGPWSENRHGFCGAQPQIGPVASIDKPDGGFCHVCAKFVCQGDDGNWYVKADAPLPFPKRAVERRYEDDVFSED